ncbi:hypothetical protein PMIT1312_00736 [Prochlorococcus marinus str. MIT 1312]|nr:hypothetical protein PMIT1312_00736 [Prochlorococcus marinus str. MIT 1312]
MQNKARPEQKRKSPAAIKTFCSCQSLANTAERPKNGESALAVRETREQSGIHGKNWLKVVQKSMNIEPSLLRLSLKTNVRKNSGNKAILNPID